MARYLKTGRPPEQATADAKKVRDIVTGIIEDIESRGETALREISAGCLRTYERSDGKSRGRAASDRIVPAISWQAKPGRGSRDAPWRSGRNLLYGRRAGNRRHGTRHQSHRSRLNDRRPGQCLCS